MIGFWERVAFAFRCFLSILFHAEIPEDIQEKLIKGLGASLQVTSVEVVAATPLREETAPPIEPADRAVQMLALLQRDGRLIDFLNENISGYADAQIGAAVRTIHQNCRQVLDRCLRLEPIFNSEEDQPVTVQPGFDPASIKLIGNVTGDPPIRGLLRHRGWRVREVDLPPLPQAGARMVLAPAEVELS